MRIRRTGRREAERFGSAPRRAALASRSGRSEGRAKTERTCGSGGARLRFAALAAEARRAHAALAAAAALRIVLPRRLLDRAQTLATLATALVRSLLVPRMGLRHPEHAAVVALPFETAEGR